MGTRAQLRRATPRRAGLGAVCGLLSLALACAGPPPEPTPPPARAGTVEGRILPSPAVSGAGGWVVVYLEGPGDPAAPEPAAAALHTGPEGLAPAALAITTGQPLELRIHGDIHHRFFSSSFPNEFRLPRSGARQRVAFEHPGVVHVYCSLHPNERATIFVAPSRHFAAVQAPGEYSIADVPPGRYSLHAWFGDHTAPVREVTVTAGRSAFVEVTLDGGAEP